MSATTDVKSLDQLRNKASNTAANVKADIGSTIDDAKEAAANAKDSVTADLAELLQAAKSSGKAELAAAAERLSTYYRQLSDSAAALGERGRETARAAIETTDEYVKDNPWQSVAIGTGVGALLGFALGCMASRR